MELADTSGNFEVTEQVARDSKMEIIEQLAEVYGADPEDLQEALGDITETEVNESQQMFGGQNGTI